ncbi:MAG: AMP-binding protein [Christensenellales bacterium]|jgi:acetyl-CoA synthetase
MKERFMLRDQFDSYEDFKANYQVRVPDRFNYAYDVVDAWAQEQPDRLALIWCDDEGTELRYSFEQIRRLSNQAARFFLAHGIGKGDRVMMMLRRRWEFWICCLGLMKIGAIIIPASNQLTTKDIVYRCNTARVKMLLAIGEPDLMRYVDEAMPQCATVVSRALIGPETPGWIDLDGELAAMSDQFTRPTGEADTRTDDVMLIYFTSGTTGMPKMVAHEYEYPLGHMVTAGFWHQVVDGGLHYTASDSGWAKFGWGCFYGQWICGTALLGYDMEKFHPDRLLAVVTKYRPTTFCVPPTIYRFMLREDLSQYDLSSIRHFSTAGEPLAPEINEQWFRATGKHIYEGMGQTESSVMMGNFQWFEPRPGSMGKPSPLYDIALINENGEVCGVGEEGEVVVRGVAEHHPVGLFHGYYTQDGRIVTPWRDGDYHTGDMAWMDEDGYYWFVGRNDDMIKCSGYRIGPFEVESALLKHPAVLECAITGEPDPLRGQVVKATIVLAPGYTGSDALVKEIQTFVKHNTAPYKYPRRVAFVDRLPKTTSGKISRVQIRNAQPQ